jgi:hypothetical protein
MTEEEMILQALNERLVKTLREVDYLISYGKICEARSLIGDILGLPPIPLTKERK